jgi:hypothetical protein
VHEDDAIGDRADEERRQEEDLEILRALLIFIAFTNSSLVFAQANSRQLLPTIETGSVKTDIFGWSWSTHNSNTDEISHNLLRVRGIITDEASPWGGFFDLQLKDPGDRETNLLQELRISYNVTDDWQLRLGRLFTAAGYITPISFQLETSRYPRHPMAPYIYGLQLAGSKGKWRVIADIGGASGLLYDESDQFRRMEFSTAVRYSFTGKMDVSFITQLSKEFSRVSLDFGYRPTNRDYFKGTIYSADEDLKESTNGGYVFYERSLYPFFAIHTQVDRQNATSGGSTIWTNGFRLIGWEEGISLTFDHETRFGDGGDVSLIRLRLRF